MTVKDSQVTIISTVTAEHIGTNGTAQIFDTRSPAEVILFKPQTRVSSVSLTDTLSELFWMVFHIFWRQGFFLVNIGHRWAQTFLRLLIMFKNLILIFFFFLKMWSCVDHRRRPCWIPLFPASTDFLSQRRREAELHRSTEPVWSTQVETSSPSDSRDLEWMAWWGGDAHTLLFSMHVQCVTAESLICCVSHTGTCRLWSCCCD